jgi:hypothetical protein
MTTANYITIVISLAALIISSLTFWLTRLKRGSVKMTKPTVIFFGPDGVGEKHSKIFIRTLLYSTSDRGQYIENMFIRIQQGGTIQNFNVWIYDDKGLVRGSGLFINKSGLAYNHHFLLPKDGNNYVFLPGNYTIQVFIEPVNKKPKKIFECNLELTEEQSDEMKNKECGIYFDWAPNIQSYFSQVDIRPTDKKNSGFNQSYDRK